MTFDSLLHFIRGSLQRTASQADVDEIERSPLLEEHELIRAAYVLLSKRIGREYALPQFSQHPSGAITFFEKGIFPWGALPYPREHAELGSILSEMDQEECREIVSRMAQFQLATLDHQKRPIHTLFHQEKGCRYEELEKAVDLFFLLTKIEISSDHRFVDEKLGMVAQRSSERCCVLLGSGCKSGMGVFLHQDTGVINFGPQQLPLGDCDGFGLAGKAQQFNLQEDFSLSYRCRLASRSTRDTGFAGLKDSGYSAFWIEVESRGSLNGLEIDAHLVGFKPLSTLAFSFFGKAEACYVAGNHKLNPRSLDRYKGPAKMVELRGEKGSVLLEVSGSSEMEIIPLAGDESYWGADFLIAFMGLASDLKIKLS